MNNKGQTLVLFVILLPIILILFGVIIEKSYLLYNEKQTKNIGKIVCNYALDNKTDTDIKQLALENDNKLTDIKIEKSSEQVIITLEKDINSIFGKLLGKSTYKIKTISRCR